jgi:hypothetical protein
VQLTGSFDDNVVRFRVNSPQISAGAEMVVSLRQGVPRRVGRGATAGAGRASFDIGREARVEIHDVYPAEGANGFYLQVVCDDLGLEDRVSYYDDVRGRYYRRLSKRCLPDDEAIEHLRVEPSAGTLSVAPSAGGFRVFGDFSRGSYALHIDEGLRTQDGSRLGAPFESELTVPSRSPSLRFVTQGRYLPRSAWRSLPLSHLNVRRALLTIRHVPPENLVFWMSDDDSEAVTERTANVLVRRAIDLEAPPDGRQTTYLDVADMVPADTKGLLEIRVSGEQSEASVRLLLTDLQLIAKRTGPPPEAVAGDLGEVVVWAIDSETTQPERGVEVSWVRKSGFAVARCRTGGDGGCRLVPPAGEVDPNPPFALIARKGGDLTYLRFADLRAEVQEARVSGEPYRPSLAADVNGEDEPARNLHYKAAPYSDRGVYRPGETAHLAAIVRTADAPRAPQLATPVEVALLDPRGRVTERHTLATNAAGYVTLDTRFPDFADTGRYEAQFTIAEREIGRLAFQVEEFVPERMEVEAEAGADAYLLGDAMTVEVSARYLFGGVPAGQRVELGCELVAGRFTPKENSNFEYGVWTPEEEAPRPVALGTVDATLDDDGAAAIECPSPAPGRRLGLRGPARLIGRAAVFEAGGGRTSVGRAEAPVHPERFYLGLASSAAEAKAGADFVVDGVTVDWQGHRVKDVSEVKLELLRLETDWGMFWDEASGRESYRRYLRPVVERQETVRVSDGKFRVTWQPSQDANAFVVRATAGAARTDLRLEGSGDWYYYWAPQQSRIEQTPKPGRPTWIEISGPTGKGAADAKTDSKTDAKVRVGEPVEVRFNAPYRGRVLMTVETDRLLESRWLDVDQAGPVTWRFELDELVPNVYVTAFLVKDPHLDDAGSFLPDRAFGVASLAVEPSALTQRVELDVPREVRSGTTLEVGVTLTGERSPAAGTTYLTVAAVDEGVLSLTNFSSPDPLALIFNRRALGVETFETIGWTVVVPPADPASAAGGDGSGSLGRIDGIKPVALWSGLVEVPASGKATVRFELPAYRGALRVMAVAAGPQRIGHADRRVVVRDPLVVQSTVPRFLTGGDEVTVPVHVTNLSGQGREVTVSLAARELAGTGLAAKAGTPPVVELLGGSEKSLFLEDGAAGTVLFRARAARPVGAAALTVKARSGELSSEEETVVPVLPAGPRVRRNQRVELAAGTTDLAPYLRGWVPLSERTSVWVTANPYGDAFDHLKYLIRYPYGCLEQTTSSSRPLLWVGKLLSKIDPEVLAEGSIEDRVMRGVDRLLTMQTPAGGFAYWQGGSEPAYWATAYATQFLIEAREQRYAVPEERIEEALAWMARQVDGRYVQGHDDHYSRDAEPYMHYVLALGGKPRKARASELLAAMADDGKPQTRESRFLLQAALYLAGDQRYETQLRHPDLRPVSNYRSTGWSFYSDRRMRALMLSTYVDLFGRSAEIEPLANLVAESLRGQASGWYTTQELVWGVTGLGKMVEAGAADFAPPTLAADGERLTPQRAPGDLSSGEQGSERIWEVARASEYGALTVDLPKKGDGKVWAILSSQGVRADEPAATGGEGLRVTRRWLDADGTELASVDGGRRMKLGDPVFVELSLTNLTAERISNVALVDRIPAGWEIENPRLGRGGADGLDWLDPDALWQPDHLNLRDDRLEVFGAVEKGATVRVVYGVRAVSAGSFRIPTAEAEAMYDPRIWAREAGGRAVILGPWKEGGQ